MSKEPHNFSEARIKAVVRYCLKNQAWKHDRYEKNLLRYNTVVVEGCDHDALLEDEMEGSMQVEAGEARCCRSEEIARNVTGI